MRSVIARLDILQDEAEGIVEEEEERDREEEREREREREREGGAADDRGGEGEEGSSGSKSERDIREEHLLLATRLNGR